eukprot:gene12330-6004_t
MSEKKKWSGTVYDNSYFGYHCNLVGQKMISKFDIKENMNVLDAGCGTGAITLELLKTFENMNVLDAGCGTGAITLELLKTFGEKINITSVDFSKDMAVTLNNKIPKENTNVVVHEASIEDLSILKDETFDVVFCNMVMFFVTQQDAAFSELKRVTKKGAKIFVSVWEVPEKCEAMQLYYDFVQLVFPGFNMNYIFNITDDSKLTEFSKVNSFESLKIHHFETKDQGTDDEIFNLFVNTFKLLQFNDVSFRIVLMKSKDIKLRKILNQLRESNKGTVIQSKVAEYTK